MGKADHLKKYQFKKGQSGNLSGRPKKEKNRAEEFLENIISKQRLKELKKMTPAELATWENVIINATNSELFLIASSEDAPAYARSLALAVNRDLKKGKTTTIDKLMLRVYGG